jgi:uroporphyrinogen decarboxylase
MDNETSWKISYQNLEKLGKLNSDFIKLCLNANLSSEITLQPLKRFNLDAAIIFSDILMLPYGLNQKVEFEKGFGPKLGEVNIDEMSKLDEIDFVQKIYPVYKAIQKVSSDNIIKSRDKNTYRFCRRALDFISLYN